MICKPCEVHAASGPCWMCGGEMEKWPMPDNYGGRATWRPQDGDQRL